MNDLRKYAQFLLVFFALRGVSAQDLSVQLPQDDHLRMGTLPNGLRYYIRANSEPEHRVEFRLMVDVGSVDEDDDQLGIAHFTEHMLFNGTKSFKKNEVVDFLKSIGVSFGADLNAYTSFEETVYSIHAPTNDLEKLDKCFLLIKEWMSAATFDKKEIDAERKVILEEKRTRSGAMMRRLERMMPLIAEGSRYKDHLPIGTEDGIQNSSYASIHRFYKEWYRPDLIGFAIVGDLDPELMEAKIKEFFAPIVSSERVRPKIDHSPPVWSEQSRLSIYTDPENVVSTYTAYYKGALSERMSTLKDMREEVIYRLISGMFNDRMEERAEMEVPAFQRGFMSIGPFFISSTRGPSYTAMLFNEPGAYRLGIEAVQRVIRRVLIHGFTEEELDKHKKSTLRRYRDESENQEKKSSDRYAHQYVAHFIDPEQTSLMNDHQRYAHIQELLPSIGLGLVNETYRKLHEGTQALHLLSLTERDSVSMSEDEFAEAIETGKRSDPEPYVSEQLTSSSLLNELPPKGRVLSKEVIAEVGITEVILSNQIKVILKPTEFEENQVLLDASTTGGASMFEVDEFMSFRMLNQVSQSSGLGAFSRKELERFLADKIAGIDFDVGEYTHGLRGSSSTEDLEILMQLVYLSFTSLRTDEQKFKSMMKKQKSQIESLQAHPLLALFEGANQMMYQNHPRRPIVIPNEEQLDGIDLEKVSRAHRKAYGRAADFTFYVVGSFEIDAILPLLEQYIATLPNQSTDATHFIDHNVRITQEPIEERYSGGMEGSSYVAIQQSNYAAYDAKEIIASEILSELISDALTKKLREKEGGVYSASGSVVFEFYPVHRYGLNVFFPCDPKRTEKLINLTKRAIARIQKGKIRDKDLEKAKEIIIKDYEEALKENNVWMRLIKSCHLHQLPYDQIGTKIDRIKSITKEDIKASAERHIDLERLLIFTSYPTKE